MLKHRPNLAPVTEKKERNEPIVPLAPTPENIAKLQQQLAQISERIKEAEKSGLEIRTTTLEQARQTFAASMQMKVAPDARQAFSTLYTELQAGTATPESLELAMAAVPIHPMFTPIHADLSNQVHRQPALDPEQDQAREYAKGRNKAERAKKGANT